MEKCIFYMQEPARATSEVVWISAEAMEIISKFRDETGLKAGSIVGKMIKFCEDKIEIREV